MQYAASASHDDWRIASHDIAVGEEIGRGAFGVVHKATYHGMDVVVKKIAASAEEAEGQFALKLLDDEVRHLSKLRHRNIVPLIGMCENPVMLVLAYAEHKNLKKFLENNPSVSTPEKLKILAREVVSEHLGVFFLPCRGPLATRSRRPYDS